MKVVLGYAVAAAVVAGVGAAVAAEWLVPHAAREVWLAAGVAYALQVVAFAALFGLRERLGGFLLAWTGGTLLRFGAVIVAAVWIARTGAASAAPLLLSLTGFLFVLLLLEPVFFRLGMRAG